MSDTNLPKLVIADEVRYAQRPIISDLVDCTFAKIPHKLFTITAPEEVCDFLWKQLYDSGAVVDLEKKTRFVIEVVVSPLADAEKFRSLVMAYIFQIYMQTGAIQDYQEEKTAEALASFFGLPVQIANLAVEALKELNTAQADEETKEE